MLRGRRDRHHRLGPADPVHRRGDRRADPVRRRRHRGARDRQRPAGQVRGDGVRTADRAPARDRVDLRHLHGRRGEGRDRHPRPRLVPRRLQHRHEGHRATTSSRRRPPAGQHVLHWAFDIMVGIGTRADRAGRVARARPGGAGATSRRRRWFLRAVRGLRRRRGRRAGVRLDRDRGRAPAWIVYDVHADQGRASPARAGSGSRFGVVARALHGARCRDRARCCATMARRWRDGRGADEVDVPYGPRERVPPAT